MLNVKFGYTYKWKSYFEWNFVKGISFPSIEKGSENITEKTYLKIYHYMHLSLMLALFQHKKNL